MNVKNIVKTTLLALPLAIFVGCGGGGGNTTANSTLKNPIKGVFVDSAVSGISFSCSSGNKGITNSKGEFTCEKDDRVSFSIGSISLGEVVISKTITPTTLFKDNSEAALNLAQLLQTLDSDGDLSNGISPSLELINNLENTSIDFSSNSFDEDVQNFLGNDVILVTEESAQEHLNETFSALGISADGTDINDTVVIELNETNESIETETNETIVTDTTAPIFASSNSFSINENQTIVSSVTTDDLNANLSLSGTDASSFNLVDGVLSFKVAPDYETKTSYSVNVTAMDGASNISTQIITVSILNLDEVAPIFTSSNSFSINENQTIVSSVTTDDLNVNLSLSGTDASSFNLVDGVLSFKVAPDYETKLSYSITIMASDLDSNEAMQNITVNINDINDAPIANAGVNMTMVRGTIDLNASLSSDEDGDILTYQWSIISKPSSSIASFDNVSIANPSFTADLTGNYQVELSVSDGTLFGTTVLSIIATNTIPIANAGNNINSVINTLINLNASGSSDANGDSLTYTWRIITAPNTSMASLSDTTLSTPTFTPDLVGSYTLGLIVNDGDDNSIEDTVQISTLNTPPVSNAGSNRIVSLVSVTLDGSGSSDANGQAISYKWNLVSAPSGSSLSFTADTTGVSPSFIPDINGDYTFSLLVNDGLVDSSLDNVVISVDESIVLFNGLTYKSVISPTTGKAWLDRHLGASQVCISIDDIFCFGDMYQWGRLKDGHENNESSTTSTESTIINGLDSNFITSQDWVTSASNIDDDGLLRQAQWLQTDGVSGVCPADYSVATSVEFQNEMDTLNLNLSPDLFSSFLKIPAANYKMSGDGAIQTNSVVHIWLSTTSSVIDTAYSVLSSSSTPTEITNIYRANGYSVRCIKQQNRPVSKAGDAKLVPLSYTVTLDGNASFDPENSPLTYSWEIHSKPNTSTTTLSSTTIYNPQLTTDLEGDYVVNLIVNDGSEDSVIDSVTITATANNIPPVSSAGIDQRVEVDNDINFDGSGSSDINADSITYTWTIAKPDTSTLEVTGETPTYRPDTIGIYNVSLVVNDGSDDSAASLMKFEVYEVVTDIDSTTTYESIVSPYTSSIWLDRNLGASQVCTARDDANCYGDYYQAGRPQDGHEKSSSSTSEVKLTNVATTSSDIFITDTSSHYDWVEDGVDDDLSLRVTNMAKLDGSSACPVGYRIPTKIEIQNETINNSAGDSFDNYTDAYNSFLKLPTAGVREKDGSFSAFSVGQKGFIWTNTLFSAEFESLYFRSSAAGVGMTNWNVDGASIRCIKAP